MLCSSYRSVCVFSNPVTSSGAVTKVKEEGTGTRANATKREKCGAIMGMKPCHPCAL